MRHRRLKGEAVSLPPKFGLMSGHRLRRCPNINPKLVKCIVFAKLTFHIHHSNSSIFTHNNTLDILNNRNIKTLVLDK